MKLLIVSSFYKPSVGGVEVYTHELFSRLSSEKNTEVTIISLNTHGAKKKEIYRNIQIFRIDAFKLIATNPLFNPFELLRILKYINVKDFDMVITQARYYFLTLFIACFCKLLGIKRVHIEHNAGYMKSSNSLVEFGARMYDNLFSKFVLDSAEGLIYVSESVRRFCTEKLNAPQKKKNAIIHAGVDHVFWKRRRVKTETKKINLLYVGRIVRPKGILNLVKSMKIMPENVHLNIVGEGEEMDTINKISFEIGKENNIHIAGVMPKEGILQIMHDSDLYINPSEYSEGLQISLLEAASFGLPIISTSIPGAEDLLENNVNSIIIPDNSPATIAKTVNYLLSNRQLAVSLGNRSREKVINHFSWEQSIKKFNEFITSILVLP